MRVIQAVVLPVFVLALILFPSQGLLAQDDATPKIQEAQNVQLRWQFKPGRKISVAMQQDMTVVMNMMGQKMKVTNGTKTWMTWLVESVDSEGLATVKTRVDRAVVEIDNPTQGKTIYDSDSREELSGAAKQMSEAYKPLLGIETVTTMKQTGEVVSVVIPEEALRGIQQSAPGGMMGKDMFEKLTRDASPSFPETVSSGDTWKRESEMQLPFGKLALTSTYKYEGKEIVDSKELHRIGMDIVMEFVLDKSAGNITIDVVDQKNSGFIHFDNNSGRIVATEMKQDMTMDIDSGNGQVISQNLVQTVKTVFTDVD